MLPKNCAMMLTSILYSAVLLWRAYRSYFFGELYIKLTILGHGSKTREAGEIWVLAPRLLDVIISTYVYLYVRAVPILIVEIIFTFRQRILNSRLFYILLNIIYHNIIYFLFFTYPHLRHRRRHYISDCQL